MKYEIRGAEWVFSHIFEGELDVAMVILDDQAKDLIQAANNWQEVKRLFLDTNTDSEEFFDAISRMIQEEAK